MDLLGWDEGKRLVEAASSLEGDFRSNAGASNSCGSLGSESGVKAQGRAALGLWDISAPTRKPQRAEDVGLHNTEWAPGQAPGLGDASFASCQALGSSPAPGLDVRPSYAGRTMGSAPNDTLNRLMPPTSTFLVDDSPSFLQSAARFLAADERFDIVGVALSAQEALGHVARLKPDLVLMDLNMPGMNGLEATRRLKAAPNPPRVVILTLNDTDEYRLAALEANADGYISKSDFGHKLLPLLESFRQQDCATPNPNPQPPTVAPAAPPAPSPAAPSSPATSASAASTSTPPARDMALSACAPPPASVPLAGLNLVLGPGTLARPALEPVLREAGPLPSEEGSAARSERLRVLLAEDHTSLSHLMAVSLWRAGIETRIAPDPLSALELAESFDPHLVVLDGGSPRMEAVAVCRSIRDGSDVPILLVATRAAVAKGIWCLASTPGLASLQGLANVEEVFACAENAGALTARVLGLLSRFYAAA